MTTSFSVENHFILFQSFNAFLLVVFSFFHTSLTIARLENYNRVHFKNGASSVSLKVGAGSKVSEYLRTAW